MKRDFAYSEIEKEFLDKLCVPILYLPYIYYIYSMTMEGNEAYIKSGKPLDNAGAYAIHGLGAVIVKKNRK